MSATQLRTLLLWVAVLTLGMSALTFTGIWGIGLVLKDMNNSERLTVEPRTEHEPWVTRQFPWAGSAAVVSWLVTLTAGAVMCMVNRKRARMERMP